MSLYEDGDYSYRIDIIHAFGEIGSIEAEACLFYFLENPHASNITSFIMIFEKILYNLGKIGSDKDITFTSGTSGGTGVVYDATLVTDGTCSGEVAYFGNTTSTNQGRLYQLQSTGGWAYADADTVAGSSGLLAVATGSSSDDGMLLRGFIRDADYSAIDGTAGAKLYVNTTTGNNSFTADIPTGSGDVVRIVGYVTTASSKTIYFCPDNTFIQLA